MIPISPRPLGRRHVLAALGLSGLALGLPSRAQAFPSRPVRIIPFGTAGGPIDTIARIYSERLQQRWSQPIVIVAKPGAGGINSPEPGAKSAADGYTVMFTLPLTHINNAILHARLPYDPVRDFQPISMVGTGGPMLVARSDAPYNSVSELIAHAKKQPRGLTFGTWGNGSTAHLFRDLLARSTGTQLLPLGYKDEAAV